MKSPVMMVLLDCWNWNMNNEPYINAKGHKVLEYISDDTIILDLPFIMTTGKRLTKDMPYMKLEKKVFGEDISTVGCLTFKITKGLFI